MFYFQTPPKLGAPPSQGGGRAFRCKSSLACGSFRAIRCNPSRSAAPVASTASTASTSSATGVALRWPSRRRRCAGDAAVAELVVAKLRWLSLSLAPLRWLSLSKPSKPRLAEKPDNTYQFPTDFFLQRQSTVKHAQGRLCRRPFAYFLAGKTPLKKT
jgi:hypothetical protein